MSPRILAIDTSATLCSVALHDGNRQFLTTSTHSRRHADDLLGIIQSQLAESRLQLTDLDAIAVVSGPGSFTGLRIGMAVAQGLAFGSGKGIVTVSSLAMQARCAARLSQGSRGCFATLIAAREQEYYLGVYHDSLAQLSSCVLADQVIEAANVKVALDNLSIHIRKQLIFAGTDWTSLGVEQVVKCQADAGDLLSLAVQQFAQSGAVSPELASLSYLKDELPYRTVEQQ